jgi:hypothetical protein
MRERDQTARPQWLFGIWNPNPDFKLTRTVCGKLSLDVNHSCSGVYSISYSRLPYQVQCMPKKLMDRCEKRVYARVCPSTSEYVILSISTQLQPWWKIFCQSLCCCRDRTTDQDGSCKCLLIMGGHSVISKEMRERKRTKKSICEARVDNQDA